MIEFEINELGAELSSLRCNGREYLWQGNPDYWKRRAPILFPIVGLLADDNLRIDGVEYWMKQHGFSSDVEFNILDSHTMQLACEYPLPNYPYRFKLTAHYVVEGSKLQCNWEVQNGDDRTMHFQIGAHPAFLLPDYDASDAIHGYLQCYDAQGKIVSPMIFSCLDDGLRHSYGTPKMLPPHTSMIPLASRTFANDAILLEDYHVSSVALLDKQGHKVLTVSCPQADAFGLWAPNKPGCPFVCIEPWCGIADRYDFQGDISQRECNHSLQPGDRFLFRYEILF